MLAPIRSIFYYFFAIMIERKRMKEYMPCVKVKLKDIGDLGEVYVTILP